MISELNMRAILCEAQDEYFVPFYQRNFTWSKREIRQLIQDIYDSMIRFKSGRREAAPTYHLGTLVVMPDPDHPRRFEVIDGQQRLTCLWLLGTYLKHRTHSGDFRHENILEFPHRPTSKRDLQEIWKAAGDGTIETARQQASEQPSSLHRGYADIRSELESLKNDHEPKCGVVTFHYEMFANYLLDHVSLMRVEVPKCTDLNHYFEIMNTRGEQLEKHEVLKAYLLAALDVESPTYLKDAACLNQAWEACSQMGVYVQREFHKRSPGALFDLERTSLLRPHVRGFDDIKAESIRGRAEAQEQAKTLRELLDMEPIRPDTHESKEDGDDETEDRFEPIVDFPNFLLHALRLFTGRSVALDDKQLLPEFNDHLLRGEPGSAKRERVKAFVFNLLRYRALLDSYVIKRGLKDEGERLILKRLKNPRDPAGHVDSFDGHDGQSARLHSRIRMLQAAFHVSYPAQNYKYWLTGALRYLDELTKPKEAAAAEVAPRIEASPYLTHLESMARAFVHDRFLGEVKKEYDELIASPREAGMEERTPLHASTVPARLEYGKIQHLFVFNYLDYLLWTMSVDGSLEERFSHLPLNRAKIDRFEFTVRNSIEHYYPQNPLSDGAGRPGRLHSFGNLALVSHDRNSRLSNSLPIAKKEHYADPEARLDSIKYHLMLQTPSQVRKCL